MATAATTFTGPQFYDALLGPIIFGPFAADLAEALPPGFDAAVLEVACGTGLVTASLRRRMDAGAQLVATDLSPQMLAYARAKLGDAGIAWREANALSLPFGAGEFGGVACGFGIMFVPGKAAALREMRRVLAPGGRLLLSVWDRIEENPHNLVNAQVVEGLFPGDAEMRFRLPYEMHEMEPLRALVAAAGFEDVVIERRRHAITGADPRSIAEGQIRGTPRSALIAQRGMALESVIDQVAAALAAQGGTPYHGHAQALIVQARAA